MRITTKKEYATTEELAGYKIVGMIPRPKETIEFHLRKEDNSGTEKECPDCHKNNTRKVRKRVRTLHSLPQDGLKVLMKIEVADYECKECKNTTFTDAIVEKGKGEIPSRVRYTFAYIEWINKLYKEQGKSCNAISKLTGLSPTTICELTQ